MTRVEWTGDELTDGLHDLAGTSTPGYRDDILRQVAATRQIPARSFPERWLPMTVIARRTTLAPPWRAVWMVVLIALLAVVLAAGAALVGSQISRLMNMGPGPSRTVAAALPPTACPAGTQLESGDIATIAGTGASGTTVDGGAATSTAINLPNALAVDASGAVYFTDSSAQVRRIGTDGVLSTYAGTSLGKPFTSPSGLAFDAAGDLYVVDESLYQIFRIDPQGGITSVAGNGTQISPSPGAVEPGDEGPAVDAMLWTANVSVGPAGDIYLDGWGRYRRIDPQGIMHAFAGTGTTGWTGDDGPAIAATFGSAPNAPAADPFGNVYLNDPGNFRIRKVDTAGIISTVAGNGHGSPSGDGGPAIDAGIDWPGAIAVDATGNLYFTAGVSVRMVDTAGIIHTIAGNGKVGQSGDCGRAVDATFETPSGVAVHDGIVYIADTRSGRIRMVMP